MAGKSRAAWGIDVGQYGLRAIKLEAVGANVQVSDFEIIKYPQPLTGLPAASHDQIIRQALTKFSSRHSLKGAAVVVGVPGRNSQARFVALPPVEPKKIPQIVEFEAKQQIPFDMDDVVWDYQAIKLEDSPDVITGIFFIKRDVVEHFLSNFQEAGILTDQVQMAPMALYNAMVYDGLTDPSSATAILDVGSGNSEFIVADGQKVFHRTIPIGGNNFTQALVKTFKLSFSKAENLKRKCSTSKYAKQVFQAMRSVFSDLSGEVQRSIGFYTTLNRQAKIGRILAMGNTFRLPGLQKYLQQSLKVELIRVDQFSRLSLGPQVKAPAFSAATLSMGVAYGLALQGLGRATLSTNLLPPSIARQQVWRSKKPVFAAAVALLAIIVAGMFARTLADMSVLKRALADNGTVIDVAKGYGSQLATVEAEIQKTREKVESYAELSAHRDVWPAIIQTITKALKTTDDPRAEYTKPRSQRRLIFLQNLSCRYSQDVEKEYTKHYESETSRTKTSTTAAQSGAPRKFGSNSEKPKKGFLIEIRGITPFLGDSEYRLTSDFLKAKVIAELPRLAKAELSKVGVQLAGLTKRKITFSFSEPEFYRIQNIEGIASQKFSGNYSAAYKPKSGTSKEDFPDPTRPGESMAKDSYFCIHWKVYIQRESAKSRTGMSSSTRTGSAYGPGNFRP